MPSSPFAPAGTDNEPVVYLKKTLDERRDLARKSWESLERERERVIASGVDVTKPESSKALNELTRLTAAYEIDAAAAKGAENAWMRSVETRVPNGNKGGLGELIAPFSKGLAEGSGSGSFVVPPQFAGSVWDRLAAESVALRSGIAVIETTSDELHLPRLTADATANWTSEGDPISDSEPTLDEVIARPRKLAALVALTNELIADSHPAVLDVVTGNLVRSLALKLDAGIYNGSGIAPEITGLVNQSDIQGVEMGGGDGAPIENLDPLAEAISLLEEENAEATAVILHPRTWGTLAKLKELDSGSNKPLLQDSAGSGSQGIRRSIYGVPVYLSSQIPVDETEGASEDATSVWVYQADQVVAVRRQYVSIEIDRSALFSSDQSLMRAISRWDLVLPNPKAVCRIFGIVPGTPS
jgi:HK97 family phage major capsid protein